MGTRINVIIGTPYHHPSCILYSNSSHEDVDAETIVRRVVKEVDDPGLAGTHGLTEVAERLLQLRYMTDGGGNKRGDRVFTLDSVPFDQEFILYVKFDFNKEALVVTKDTGVK